MLTGEQRALLRLVREVARRQVAPRAPADGDPVDVPADLFALLAELDLLGLPFPRADGGREQPATIVCHVLAELSGAFLAVGLGTSTHLMTTQVVADHADPRVRIEILPRLIAGEWLGGHALASGRNSGATARAVRDGDWYVIDGVTQVAATASRADCYVVGCRTAAGDGPADTLLLVPSDLVGRNDADSRAAGQLRWSALRVPADHRLGGEGEGVTIASDALDRAHLGVAACAVGLARAALDAAVTCVRRAGFTLYLGPSVPIAMMADLGSAVEAAVTLCDRTARACDAGQPFSVLAAMARQTATGTAVRVAEWAAEIERDTAVTTGRTLRYRREATVLQTVEGGEDGPRETIARELLGDRDAR